MPASIGVNMRVTGHYSQGGRKYMEDKFSVAYQQTEDEKDLEYAYFGIFDGHGGSEAADFAKEHLMDSIVKQRQFWSDSDDDVLRAIRNGYMMTHLNMWKELDKWPKTVSGLPSTAGTTASVAFIRGGKIYIGHVGDSAIVLGYQIEGSENWCAKPLTLDHKPESSQEILRIQSSGGKVVAKAGVHRVVWNRPAVGPGGALHCNEIPFLAVARSLGDLWSYNASTDEFIVSPDPDVGVLSIDPAKFRCLIFGTDGLWNMVSAEAAVQLVQAAEKHNEKAPPGAPPPDAWLNPSKILVDSALQRWSSTKMRADNTSVVTLMMDPPGPPRNRAAHPPPPSHPYTPPLGGPETEPSSQDVSHCTAPESPPVERPPTPEPEPAPSRGLSIVTRFPDPRPLPPPPNHQNYSYTTTHEEEETFITNYGNPSESYFIARLLNKTQIRNTLQNVHEEITTVEMLHREDREIIRVTNNNNEDNPYRKTSVLQRPSAPSPLVETPRQPSPRVTPSPVVETVPEEPEKSQPVEHTTEKSPDTPAVIQESIQINEVSSSSPVDSPPKPKNRKPKTVIHPNVDPKPPCRNLRSHDTPLAPPRPQTRFSNKGRPNLNFSQQTANRTRNSDSKVPVAVHGKPNPQFEKVVILNRPKLSQPPSMGGRHQNDEQKNVAKVQKHVPVITKIKQAEPKMKSVLPKGDGDAETINTVRVTRSKDTGPSPADLLLKAVKDTAMRKSQLVQANPPSKEMEVQEVKQKDEVVRPAIITRHRNTVTTVPPGASAPRSSGTFLRRREPALDNPENSKENMLTPSSQSGSTVPLKSAKRRNSGGGLNDLEPKEKRRTRLDDKRKMDKTVEEQHQDISSTEQLKDTNYMLGLHVATVELHSLTDMPSRRSLRYTDDPMRSEDSPKPKLRNKNKKSNSFILDDGASTEVHSTTINLENEPLQGKNDTALTSRALRSRQENLQQGNRKIDEISGDKRSLRSGSCTLDRLNDVPMEKECRPVLRSKNTVTGLTPKMTPRRVRTPWGNTSRQSLRKRYTK